MTIATVLKSPDLCQQLSAVMGVSLAIIRRKLQKLSPQSQVQSEFQPAARQFAGVTVAKASKDSAMLERLAACTKAGTVRKVRSRLEKAAGNTLVAKVFEFRWPDDDEAVEPGPVSGVATQPSFMGAPIARNHLFISYSHLDRAHVDRLLVHLSPLKEKGLVDPWDDHRIQTGQDWRQEIDVALARAAAAVLMVSADFAASDFVVKNELPLLLERNRLQGLRLFPVIARPISPQLHNEGLLKYKGINRPEQPLSGMTENEREKLFADLAGQISLHFTR